MIATEPPAGGVIATEPLCNDSYGASSEEWAWVECVVMSGGRRHARAVQSPTQGGWAGFGNEAASTHIELVSPTTRPHGLSHDGRGPAVGGTGRARSDADPDAVGLATQGCRPAGLRPDAGR